MISRNLLTAVLACLCLSAAAQDSPTLRYDGRIKVGGKPYSGTGYFFFSLENGNGEIVWTSGDFPFRGSTNNPPNAVKISVTNGAYETHLGSMALGMTALSARTLMRAKNPRLKVWFNDGLHGWEPMDGEAPLGSIAETLAADNQSGEMLDELRAIRRLLERQNAPPAPAAPQPPATASVHLTGPSIGRLDAPLVLVEFTDYQCPYCKRFQDQTMPGLMKKYVDTGKLRIVSRNLPLPFHANAVPAAQAALCSGQQDKYWAMRDALFARSADLTATNVLAAAAAAKLDVAQFTICLQAKTFAGQVQQDSQDAGAAGISGTPSFVLGKPHGGELTGLVIVGAMPLSEFDAEIQKLLNAP